MKYSYLTICSAVLLASCNQTAPVTSAPTTSAASATAEAPASKPAAPDSAAAPADGVATAPPHVAPKLQEVETLKMSFSFKPVPDPDDPKHPKTNAHLLLQGAKPMDIDLGKFAGKPDIVNAAKAKAANFPDGMLLGFRSYQASTGISSDLAVLVVDARRLRIVQRRVEETAPEAGIFETSREIPLPANTAVVAGPTAQK
ncbi:hypothetical protein [Hymenobacter terrenus]|uniref:hypothetical protein n=1 Tax=Hymenobacter terrenus TaxID=1629124 RepID=UPI000619CB3D|nr:hypothetical protein [Hymenobacter terrenus]